MGEIGKGLKSFKEGLSEEDEDKFRRYSEQRSANGDGELSDEQGSARLNEKASETEASRAERPSRVPVDDRGL
jgi:Sec-independent protein translocase protein TatA